MKTKSPPQSMHFRTLSWNSIEDAPFGPNTRAAASRRHLSGVRECASLRTTSPHSWNYPGFGPPCVASARSTSQQRPVPEKYCCSQLNTSGRPGEGRPLKLVLFLTRFFTATFTCKRFLHTLLFTWFQVEGMTLDLLDDVFLLNFAFETPQSIFEGLALLQSNFSQRTTPPNSSGMDRVVITRFES